MYEIKDNKFLMTNYSKCLIFSPTCGTNSNLANTSGYVTNANPVPPCTTFLISFPVSYDKFPKIPNIMHPERSDVKVSRVVTIVASLWRTNDFKNL